MAKKGLFRRLFDGLSKTRSNILSKLDGLFSGRDKINDEFYEELEEILITSDIGVRTTMDIIERLQEQVEELDIKQPMECKELLINDIREKMNLGDNAYEFEEKTSVVLVIGVNGVGKTTSIGKLAAQLKGQGKKVMLAAADTFRAGAIDQLGEWANRAGVPMVAQQEGADPGAVVYDAIQSAKSKKIDVLICDTAGRLHNKKTLMDELNKINRIIDKEYPEAFRETLIVLDGMTGQNALTQAKEFTEVAKITGIILTKMDGTAKGGIAVAIQSELGVPVKYIGVGEGIEDLQKFDSEDFVNAMFTTPEFELEEEETMVGFKEPEAAPAAEPEANVPAVVEPEETGLISLADLEELSLIFKQKAWGVGSEVWEAMVTATIEEEIEDPETFDWSPYMFEA